MTFLPIVARELRVTARRPGAYWNRVFVATFALIIGALVYANFSTGALPELGLALFLSLSWLSFIFAALAGARLTADTISEERREGTLGLLFLTDLKGYDIVLGKLAASSLSGVYSLLAIVPILGTTLLFGGISGRQFGLTVLVLVNTLFCSLAIGSWVSTWFENGRRAVLVTVAMVAALCLLPWLALWMQGLRTGFSQQPEFLFTVPSPILAMVIATLPSTALPPASMGPFLELFWPSVATSAAITVLCFLLSSFAVPRVWQDRPAGSVRARTARRWERWRFGTGATRAALRARLLAVNPIFWLNARDRLKPWAVWATLGLGAAILGWIIWELPDDWDDPGFLLVFSQCVYGVLKLWIAAAVVVRLAEDRRTNAIELLLTVPLTLADIGTGLRRALQRQFLVPILAVLAVDAWFCSLALTRDYGSGEETLALYAARMSLLVFDAVVLWRLGPWVAVTARHANQAAANLLVRVCVIPWLAFLGGAMALALLDSWHVLRVNLDEWEALGAWFGLGVLNNLFWLAHARRRTAHSFREAAASRYGGRPGWWRAFWRLN